MKSEDKIEICEFIASVNINDLFEIKKECYKKSVPKEEIISHLVEIQNKIEKTKATLGESKFERFHFSLEYADDQDHSFESFFIYGHRKETDAEQKARSKRIVEQKEFSKKTQEKYELQMYERLKKKFEKKGKK